MNIFDLRDTIVSGNSAYVKSFIRIRDTIISTFVEQELKKRRTIEPLIQLNPLFEQGRTIDTLIDEKVLYPACARIFRRNKSADNPVGDPLFLHKHQEEAVRIANAGHSYVLMTDTGSGKSLTYIRIMCCSIRSRGVSQKSPNLFVVVFQYYVKKVIKREIYGISSLHQHSI